jgi:multidrug efflux pump subunit AcrB
MAEPGDESAGARGNADRLGFAGRIARTFLGNTLTPVLALGALLLGLLAAFITPREEEPQIDVTFATVRVPFPGASAERVENLVVFPMEQILSEIAGVDHLYSVARPGLAILTVQFKVGQKRNDAIVRLYNAVYSNRDWQPPGLSVGEALVSPKGIDDVPILTLTLWSKAPDRSAIDLAHVARTLQAEIQRVPGTRDVYTIGAPMDQVRVDLDPARLSGYGLTALELEQTLEHANVVRHLDGLVGNGRETPVQAGTLVANRDDVADLVVAAYDGRPVYLQDVADVHDYADAADKYVWFAARDTPAFKTPAVTLAITKKPGENASAIAAEVQRRVDTLRGSLVPSDVEVTVTRDYGVTARDKATQLIHKLVFATLSVVALVVFAVGWREGVIIGVAVTITLSATLFASWAAGFTINRVSLFALIFAIGILVDDAIVVVENVHRRLRIDPRSRSAAIAAAVDEVGGPTILATFTVISALLPMAFVSGLMGPYMSPIPINASMGMLISLAIALAVTPWACARLLTAKAAHDETATPRIHAFYARVLGPFVACDTARKHRHRLYVGLVAAIAVAVGTVVLQWVVMKMLPFDNKSELQLVLDLPEGAPVERTAQALDELAAAALAVPEVTRVQIYAGTAAPINFNGLVRQYELRQAPELGDVQVQLQPKSDRKRSSHQIAVALREAVAPIAAKYGATLVVAEVPPGPPVRAPIVAELYAPTTQLRRELAEHVRAVFAETPGIVDVDTSLVAPSPRLVVEVDREKAMQLGVSQADVVESLAIALNGRDATYLHRGQERAPVPVRVELQDARKDVIDAALLLDVRTNTGRLVPLRELVRVRQSQWDAPIWHKDLQPLEFVIGDAVGSTDSPLYGMFAAASRIETSLPDVDQHYFSAPSDPDRQALKWDGEWQITYETFRDMGIAYSVGLVLIYLLIVAEFRSYVVPLIVMAPIPLTIIGVLPGHALLGAQFTATSMIGVIALAGIIVRNSILLVDFIRTERTDGTPLAEAVIRAGATRTRPIVLTALAASLGALFILDDPIFNGLAVALLFGNIVSTLLTLGVIPILYFAYETRKARATQNASR